MSKDDTHCETYCEIEHLREHKAATQPDSEAGKESENENTL